MLGRTLISVLAIMVMSFNSSQANQISLGGLNGMLSSPVVTVYQMVPGITLKQGLSQWAVTTSCQISHVPHWQIYWQSNVDYSVDAPLIFHQDFLQAISNIIHLYARAQIPLYAHIYQQQCLIVIDTR